jgi:hypothetical protein
MKYDRSQERKIAEFLSRPSKKLERAGASMHSAGEKLMKFGCSLMILAVLGIMLIAAIF